MSETVRGGGQAVFASEKIQGLTEVAVGGVVGTGYLWMPLLDNIASGLHIYTAVGGAVVVTHGLLRILRGWRGR